MTMTYGFMIQRPSCFLWFMGWISSQIPLQIDKMEILMEDFVMTPAQEKIEKIDQRLRIQPLRGGNLLYIT